MHADAILQVIFFPKTLEWFSTKMLCSCLFVALFHMITCVIHRSPLPSRQKNKPVLVHLGSHGRCISPRCLHGNSKSMCMVITIYARGAIRVRRCFIRTFELPWKPDNEVRLILHTSHHNQQNHFERRIVDTKPHFLQWKDIERDSQLRRAPSPTTSRWLTCEGGHTLQRNDIAHFNSRFATGCSHPL